MTTPEDPDATRPGYGQPASGQPTYGQPTYGQPTYGQPTYGQPGAGWGPPPAPYGPPPQPGQVHAPTYGYPVPPQTDGTAIVVLVCAVSSFVVFPVIPAVVALALAGNAERDIAASGGRLTGEGLIRAGRMVAWINLGLAAAALLMVLLFFGAFGALAFAG